MEHEQFVHLFDNIKSVEAFDDNRKGYSRKYSLSFPWKSYRIKKTSMIVDLLDGKIHIVYFNLNNKSKILNVFLAIIDVISILYWIFKSPRVFSSSPIEVFFSVKTEATYMKSNFYPKHLEVKPLLDAWDILPEEFKIELSYHLDVIQ